MRTNEERLGKLHKRAAQLERKQRNNRFSIICAVSAAVCIGMLSRMAALISEVSQTGFSDDVPAVMNASIFSNHNALSYIVIAILAFLLGIIVTIFCFRLKKYLDEKNREDL